MTVGPRQMRPAPVAGGQCSSLLHGLALDLHMFPSNAKAEAAGIAGDPTPVFAEHFIKQLPRLIDLNVAFLF